MKMPPSNNMGAQVTSAPVAPEKNQVLIDWLTFSVKENDPDKVLQLVGLDDLPFGASGSGGMGYKSSRRAGNIAIYFDGNVDMGCCVVISGKGCREFEQYRRKDHCWYSYLHHLRSVKVQFTRIDIALDNIDGTLDLSAIRDSLDNCEYRSRFKTWSEHVSGKLNRQSAQKLGRTIYLGSPQSRLKVRFYDKAAQLGIESTWNRAELQLMAERATEAIEYMLKGVELGDLAASVLNQYFQPVNLDDVNISRCSVKSWWEKWLETLSKLRLAVKPSEKYIPHVCSYLKRQYSATFAMLREYYNKSDFNQFIQDLVFEGKDKLTLKHKLIIQRSRFSCEVPF